MVVQLLVGQESRLEALVAALQELVVVEVENRRWARSYLRPGKQLVADDRVERSGPWRNARGLETVRVRTADAIDIRGRDWGIAQQTIRDQLAVREIARRGGHRLLLMIDEITGEVALAIIEVAAHEYGEV